MARLILMLGMLSAIGAILVLQVRGCTAPPPTEQELARLTVYISLPDEEGEAHYEGEVGTRSVPPTATEFTLRVSGSDMQTVVVSVPRQPGVTELSVEIPAGRDRTVTVSAYDATGFKVAEGSARTDIHVGVVNTVELELKRLGGLVIIISDWQEPTQ